MTSSKDIHGKIVTESEVSSGLGFASVEDFRFFSKHIDTANKIVVQSLIRWFGKEKGESQISFEIASKLTEYFCAANKETNNDSN